MHWLVQDDVSVQCAIVGHVTKHYGILRATHLEFFEDVKKKRGHDSSLLNKSDVRVLTGPKCLGTCSRGR